MQNLRSHLIEAGVSQRSVATALGVSPRYVSDVLDGVAGVTSHFATVTASLAGCTPEQVRHLAAFAPGRTPLTVARRYLADAGLTAADLAVEAGLAPRTVSAVLAGARRPSPAFVSALERLTGQPRELLLGEAHE